MSQDMYGMPAPSFEMLPSARAKMRRLTEKWKGSNMVIIVDDQALSAPRIESAIETNGIITGINDPDEIRELVAVLGGGMLPVELRYAGSSSSPRATDLRRDPWELDRRVFLEPAREEVREALKRTLHGGFIFIGPDGRETRDTIWDFFNDRRGSCSRDLGSSPDWKELGTDVVLVMDQFWWTGKQNRVRILSSTLWTREKDGLWVARFRQETIHR
jgi:hypothetical protein